MQSQHKAVLRDLKNGDFDDKIDAYLPERRGSAPRDAEAGSGRAETAPVDVGPEGAPAVLVDESPTVPVDTAAPTTWRRCRGRRPRARRGRGASPGLPPIPPRTITPPPIPAQARRTQPRASAMGAPPPVTRPAAERRGRPRRGPRRDVSQAFAAMPVDEAEAPEGSPRSIRRRRRRSRCRRARRPSARASTPSTAGASRARCRATRSPEPATRRATTAPARPTTPPRTQPPPTPRAVGEVVRAARRRRAPDPPGRVTTPPSGGAPARHRRAAAPRRPPAPRPGPARPAAAAS